MSTVSCCVDAHEALRWGVASLAHVGRVAVLLAAPPSRLMERFCVDDDSLAAGCSVQVAGKRVSLGWLLVNDAILRVG